jgi:hypothetical protein
LKQSTLERKQLEWEKQRFLLDKAAGILASPALLTTGAFVAINVLQNTKMATVYRQEHTEAGEVNLWKAALGTVNPLLMLLLPSKSPDTVIPAGNQDVTWLTDDQANVLRAGIILMGTAQGVGQSGILGDIAKLVTK